MDSSLGAFEESQMAGAIELGDTASIDRSESGAGRWRLQSGAAAGLQLILLFFLSSLTLGSYEVQGNSLQSVPDLENAMYQLIDGIPCVRLLNLTGEIGCANPGRGKFRAPVLRFTNATTVSLTSRTAVVIPASALHQFLYRTVSDPLLAEHVAAVLVEYGSSDASGLNVGFSPDTKFPQAEFATYRTNYTWNTPGSGILKRRFNFPVFLMSQESTSNVLEVSAANQKRNNQHPLHVAEFDFVMQTTKSGTHDSESCLKEWSCLPLGGYSVWSSLSPIDTSVPSERPILLVVASMDSASFFRDMSRGADSSLSGMIAMLAAVDALSKVVDVDQFEKQVIFLVFTGESWGYLGSRRFLAELTTGQPSVAGINATRIHQILEIGAVGQATNANNATFYAHKQGSKLSAPTQEILEALQTAALSLADMGDLDKVEVQLANEINPGIPPSSLMSFLQQDESVAGLVLEEFDGVFKSPFYHSYFDSIDNINATSVIYAASLIARSVYLLGHNAASPPSPDSIQVNSSLVEKLINCLLSFTPPGMHCDLVKGLITPTEEFANHYVGVLLGSPSAEPYVEDIQDTARFVWNFLASRTGVVRNDRAKESGGVKDRSSGAAATEECIQTCSREDEVCVASTGDRKGYCLLSTTRYVPAYSTRLQYGSSGWRVVAATPGDGMSEADPVWTESFWKSISLRLYLEQSTGYDEIVLLLGLSIAGVSYVGILVSKAVFAKRLKRD